MITRAQIYYGTDVTDSQWALIEPLLPEAKSGPGRRGRPPRDRRQILNSVLYVVKTGCQWRWLPQDFGPWQTVYGYFNHWSQLSVWQGIMEELNMQGKMTCCHLWQAMVAFLMYGHLRRRVLDSLTQQRIQIRLI